MKRIIIGNWKMNPLSGKIAEKLFTEIAKGVSRIKKTDIVICAPAVYLEKLSKIRTSKIKLGAQDAFWGEIGHSEMRALGESNLAVNKKIKSALASGLRPVLCVGENERDLNHGYFSLVKVQLEECLAGISKNSISKIIIAYEPVWALSSTPGRKDATADDSREMAIFIRKILSDKFGKDASKVRIIYGGSASEKDAEEFLKDGGINGLLPGRASLDPKKFIKIVDIAERI